MTNTQAKEPDWVPGSDASVEGITEVAADR